MKLRTLLLLVALSVEMVSCISMRVQKDEAVPVYPETKKNLPILSAKVARAWGGNPVIEDLKLDSLGEGEKGYYSEEELSFKSSVEKYFPLKIVPKSTDDSNLLTFIFSRNYKTHNWGLSWITTLTLGLIPMKLDAEDSLELKVFRSNGEVIGDFSSSKFGYDVYGGFLFIVPMIFSERHKNYLAERNARTDAMLGELFKKCVDAGIFKSREAKK